MVVVISDVKLRVFNSEKVIYHNLFFRILNSKLSYLNSKEVELYFCIIRHTYINKNRLILRSFNDHVELNDIRF